MAVYIGLTVGPPLGGFIVDTVGWRWIFLINLPIGIVVLLWGWFMLPRSERVEGAPRLDVAGSVLLGVFLVCLLVPLTFSPEWGWASPSTLGLLLVSAACVRRVRVAERRVESPILDLDLVLKNRLFAAANTAALLNYMALYGISLLTAIYLELVQERSASLTGWLLLSMPLLMAVLSPFSGRLSDRIGSRVLATGGMVAIAAGMVLLALMPETAPLWRVAAVPRRSSGSAWRRSARPTRRPSWAACGGTSSARPAPSSSTMRTSGQALSVALLGGIAASQLGAVGGRLLLTHGHGGGALAARAVDAYAQGYRYAMVTGAVLALVGALVSLTRGARGRTDRARRGPLRSARPARTTGGLRSAAGRRGGLAGPCAALGRRAAQAARSSAGHGSRPGRPSRGPSGAGVAAGAAGAPSTLTCGSHSSQRGRYQFQCAEQLHGGRHDDRAHDVASSSTATARPKPICWNITSSPVAMPREHADHDRAAPVMMPAVRPTP